MQPNSLLNEAKIVAEKANDETKKLKAINEGIKAEKNAVIKAAKKEL